MTEQLIDKRLYPFIFAIVVAAAILGVLAMVYGNMPRVSFGFASLTPASVSTTEPSGATCTGDATIWTVERCVWPDGLECVYGSRGGMSCNWDAYNTSKAE